jgi:hypothetical protein
MMSSGLTANRSDTEDAGRTGVRVQLMTSGVADGRFKCRHSPECALRIRTRWNAGHIPANRTHGRARPIGARVISTHVGVTPSHA